MFHVALADGRNQTRAAYAASKCAIQYSIAYWHQLEDVFYILIHQARSEVDSRQLNVIIDSQKGRYGALKLCLPKCQNQTHDLEFPS